MGGEMKELITKECPICKTKLTLPQQYLDAMRKMRELELEQKDVWILDFLVHDLAEHDKKFEPLVRDYINKRYFKKTEGEK